MKKIYLLLLLLISSFTGFAQSTEPENAPDLNELLKLELGLHGIGLSYELPVSNRFLVELSGGFGAGHSVERGSYYTDSFSARWILNDPVVYLKSDIRYNYNRGKRLLKDKSVRNNAGNYFGFQTKYTTQRVFTGDARKQVIEPQNRTLLNELHWGLQRPLGQSFLFNFHVGVGYAADFDFGNSIAYPALGAKFSYVLLKKGR